MEEQNPQRPVNPRRRKRTKMQIFKEVYLPGIIAGVALILIAVFIIGAISRGVRNRQATEAASQAASESLAELLSRQEEEAQRLIVSSQHFADSYNYDRALAALDTFSGDEAQFPDLVAQRAKLEGEKSALVAWEDPAQIRNLSFMPLMVDTQRAFKDEIYGSYYNRRFVTTEEFSKILNQLYTNGYVLVTTKDFISDADGVCTAKPLMLPQGKKPIMITQTNVSYPFLLVDGDGDKYPDKNGDGFASKLVLTADNKFACEYVDSNGEVQVGAYDLVPILSEFVAQHPDFSYRGSKATLAVTGYEGVFGYRIYADAEKHFGTAAFEKDKTDAKALAEALRAEGYALACYTYGDIGYGEKDLNTVKTDLNSWIRDVVPVLGNIDVLVYSQNSDIAATDKAYSGDKYNAIKDAGFRYFMGNTSEGKPWLTVDKGYVRQGRILVSGTTMANHAEWFKDVFDAGTVLDSSRGPIS